MYTIREVLSKADLILSNSNSILQHQESHRLLEKFLNVEYGSLYIRYDIEIEKEKAISFFEIVDRRKNGEPFALIFGSVDFANCNIKVSNKVLIPRVETEILVEKIINHLTTYESLKNKVLFDVCCGSGCIGIAIKKRFPELTVVASDISEEAIELAKRNAEDNNVDLDFRVGDLFSPFEGEVCDFFVCNPPYAKEDEWNDLDISVVNFEPKLAIVSGITGLEIYLKIAQNLKKYLNGRGWLEIGYNQGESINKLFKSFRFECYFEKDWSGNDRFFFLESDSDFCI